MTKHRIILVDTKSSNPNHYICIALHRALMNSPDVEVVIKAELNEAVPLAVANKCNLFFAFDGEELNRAICLRLAAICTHSVLWVTEDPYELSVNVANSDMFNLIFTNDSASVSAYGDKGRHLALAGAKPFHFIPVQSATMSLRYDVFFAGTAWPNRVELIREMLGSNWADEGIKAKIALPTNPHLPKVNLSLPASQLNWRTSPIDFARFANSSVATLVLPRVFSSSGQNEFAETPPPRLFEAALAGTVQLVQTKIEEAAEYFEPGKEFIYFEGAQDLIESVKKLRSDPELRYDIAVRAQNKALAQHCYENRASYVLSELQKLPSASLTEIAQPIVVGQTKPRLLFVVHNVVANGNFGGVEVYLHNISQVLRDTYEIYFYSPCMKKVSNALLLNETGEHIETFSFSAVLSPWQVTCQEREKAFVSILNRYNISTVHFHHLIGHVPSLVEVCKTLGVPSVMTFHDYYAICHKFTLLSFKGNYCKPDEISQSQCDVCLWNSHQILPGGQSTRRAVWDQILASSDSLIFNTKGSQELTERIYPSVATHSNINVLPVPTLLQASARERSENSALPLKVAILGNFASHKGGDVISRVIPLLEKHAIEFHIFGRVDGGYFWLNDHKALPQVFVHGGFDPGQIPEEIYSCHVSLHTSIWPETYCLTLSEAWDCGLVPIVSDIGALGERVTHGVNGIKIPADSEGALFTVLLQLKDNPALLDNYRNNAVNAPIARTDTHIAGLNAIYRNLMSHKNYCIETQRDLEPFSLSQLQRPIAEVWAISAASRGISGGKNHISRIRHLVTGLTAHFVDHWKRHGIKSAVRISIRYISRRL